MRDRAPDIPTTGLRVLVADDDERLRPIFAALLRGVVGVVSVFEAADGAEAVGLGCNRRLDVAVLDLNMPRLDGVDAGLRLRALQPSLQLALHSSDPDLLRLRAAGLELPLFDKLDFDGVVEWVERHSLRRTTAGHSRARPAPIAPRRDLFCRVCGYGIVASRPPARCPLCGKGAEWVEALRSVSLRPALPVRISGRAG